MNQHVPVSAATTPPVTFAASAGDQRPAQSARPAPAACPDRGYCHTGSPHQPRPLLKTPATHIAVRAQRRADPPETQPVAAILCTIPPNHTYHRLSGVAATLDRISQLKRITVEDPVGG